MQQKKLFLQKCSDVEDKFSAAILPQSVESPFAHVDETTDSDDEHQVADESFEDHKVTGTNFLFMHQKDGSSNC